MKIQTNNKHFLFFFKKKRHWNINALQSNVSHCWYKPNKCCWTSFWKESLIKSQFIKVKIKKIVTHLEIFSKTAKHSQNTPTGKQICYIFESALTQFPKSITPLLFNSTDKQDNFNNQWEWRTFPMRMIYSIQYRITKFTVSLCNNAYFQFIVLCFCICQSFLSKIN